jgi:hypothetical protein
MRSADRTSLGTFSAAALCAALSASCVNGPAVMTEQAEARRLAAQLQVSFANANESANRAVLADTDEVSVAAAKESEDASKAAQDTVAQLEPHLRSLGYQDEISSLQRFTAKFDECRKLDREILPLAVENTNLKAQRLSFGEAQEAADAFGKAVAAAAAAARATDADLQASRASVAVVVIQVLQARHIAEADNAAMDRMEQQMAVQERNARTALERLRSLSGGKASTDLEVASAALDQFLDVNRQIVQLSRRNTNVRSLALTLGRKRVVAAEAEDQLRTLSDVLASHMFTATR